MALFRNQVSIKRFVFNFKIIGDTVEIISTSTKKVELTFIETVVLGEGWHMRADIRNKPVPFFVFINGSQMTQSEYLETL